VTPIILFAFFPVGVLLLVGSYVLRRTSRKRMDTMIRMGGYTVEQIKVVRKAVMFQGRLPDDPALHEVAVTFANQAARNMPIGYRAQPLYFSGILLIVSVGYTQADLVWPALAVQLLFLAVGLYSAFVNLRGIRFTRRVAAENASAATA
jgi:hypothetical protein